MPSEPLAALKMLQRVRSEVPQFSSKIEFAQWADYVAGLLAFDEKARYKFKHKVELAKFMYNTDSSPMDAINEAIGAMNQVIAALEQKPSTIEVVSVPNAAAEPSAKEPNYVEPWYRKPIGLIGVGVVIVVIGSFAIFLLKTHFGFQI